jgi:hypothetical protein
MAQSPCLLLPLPIPCCSNPTSLGNPPWRDRIPSTLAPGYLQTDLPLPIPSPFPPHSKFPSPWGFPELNMRLTKTTSRTRLARSGTLLSTIVSSLCLYTAGEAEFVRSSVVVSLFKKGMEELIKKLLEISSIRKIIFLTLYTRDDFFLEFA